MSASLFALPVGYRLGGYEITRLIGAGGFGITYEGFNRVTERRVAIKEFFPTGLATRDGRSNVVYSQVGDSTVTWALEKFRATTTALCQLDHPNIVRVLDYIPGNNTGYMLMELLEGHTLEGWLAARPGLPRLAELGPVMDPVLDALAYVHGRGLIHRDIAPDNIIICESGRPVLIDFGALSRDVSGATRAMATIGIAKAHYTAPDQAIRDATPDATTDIYSVGAVYYRALTGHPPPDGPVRMSGVAFGEGDPLAPLVPDRPAGLAPATVAAINDCLALRRTDRPQSIADLRSRMRAEAQTEISPSFAEIPTLVAGAPMLSTAPRQSVPRQAQPEPEADEEEERPAWRFPWILAAMLLLAVLGAGGSVAYYVTGQGRQAATLRRQDEARQEKAHQEKVRQDAARQAEAERQREQQAEADRQRAQQEAEAARRQAEQDAEAARQRASVALETIGASGSQGQAAPEQGASGQAVSGSPASGVALSDSAQGILDHPAFDPSQTGPAFDCKLSRTKVEQTICEDPSLGQLDRTLNRLFNEAVTRSTPGLVPALRAVQQAWRSGRDRCATNPDINGCIGSAYDSRIAELRRAENAADGSSAAPTGPSFACAIARGPVESAICRDPRLSQHDRALDVLFQRVRGRSSEREQAQLDNEQRAWLRRRDACESDLNIAPCIARAYDVRLRELGSR